MEQIHTVTRTPLNGFFTDNSASTIIADSSKIATPSMSSRFVSQVRKGSRFAAAIPDKFDVSFPKDATPKTNMQKTK